MIPYEWIDAAAERIAPHIRHTPLTHDAQRGWFFKWENHQVTGSFKPRGALNKTLSLQPWERARGLVAASSGNHGQGLALAGQLTGAQVDIFVPADTPKVKLDAMRQLGVSPHLVDGGYAEAELQGKRFAAETGKTWVSPYNDEQVVAGQGTVGLEMAADLPDLPDLTVLVPVSGGSLLAGVAQVLKTHHPRWKIIGVQSENAPYMHHLFYYGSQAGLPVLPSLADGLLGAVEEPSLNLPAIKNFVDEIILVSEAQIAAAIAFAWREYGERVEGAGAVPLAALLDEKNRFRPAAAVISGGNIDNLQAFLDGDDA